MTQNALAGGLDLGPFAQGAYTGTEPFNTSGQCHEPGDDCGNNDMRVRTGDLVQYSWSVVATDFQPGDADYASVIFEQTITSDANASVRFDRIPTVCLGFPAGPGGDNPPSALTDNPDGSQTLMCNLGDMGSGQQKSFSIPVRPSANSENGSSFQTKQFVYALDALGRKVVANEPFIDSGVYEISAAPAFDLMASRKDLYQGKRTIIDLGEGAGAEPGYMIYANAHIAADARRKGKGMEALSDEITFKASIEATRKDGVTSYALPYKIIECIPNPSKWPGTVYGNEMLASHEPQNSKVVDSGACAYEGDDQYGYTFTLNGIDSQGVRYPTQTSTGLSLANGPFFVAAYQIGFFVPFSAIEASDDDLSGNGGALNISTCFSDFDPQSKSGVSNYASAVEPGYNGAVMADGSATNNCTGPLTVQLSSGGGYNHRLVTTVTDDGSYTLEPLIDLAHLGATSVEATTRYAHMETFSNTASAALDDFQACFKFDNTVSKLVDAGTVGASSGQYAFIANDTAAGFNRNKWQVLYGIADFANDSPIDKNNDGEADFSSVTGRYEGNWNAMRSLSCKENLAPQWVTDPDELGIDNVNVVRFVGRDGAAAISPGQTFRAFLPLEMRGSFAGGANNGEAIPVGSVAAAVSSFRTDQFYPEWRPVEYNPSPESSQGDGDRVTFTQLSLNAVVSTQLPLASAGVTESVLAGNDVVWKITPTVSSQLAEGAVAVGLQVISELPLGSTYNARCTQQLQQGTTPTFIKYNTPVIGQQTLAWDLGNVHSADDINPVVFCAATDSFAVEDTVRVISAFARANNATPSVSSLQSIALGQSGELRAAASVDSELDSINDTQVHTLKFYNFSATAPIHNPIVISVFPHVADAHGLSKRDPASAFSGTLQLTGEPVASFSDGNVPEAGESRMGTMFYTADPAESVSDNPYLNDSAWCKYVNNQFIAVDASNGVCPASFANVTAIKYTANHQLERSGNPRQGQQINYSLSAMGNVPGDLYTSVFGFTSRDLPEGQAVRGRPVSLLVTSHSVGDFIFVDINSDGKYTSHIDVLAPDGIPVQLIDARDDSVVATTETQNGTFLFSLLGDGEYYVLIPPKAFVDNKALSTWTVAPNAKDANADANHDVDHSGLVNGDVKVNGIRTNTVVLSADAAENPYDAPSGKEPVGDNAFGLQDPTTNDDFSNLTIDIGLSSGDADNDGVLDIFEFGTNSLTDFVDSDNDGIPNYLDPDSDNDGIDDGIEAPIDMTRLSALPDPRGAAGDDEDVRGSDTGTANENRIAELFLFGMQDSDDDTQPNYLDLDSDNDAIPDALEVGTQQNNASNAAILDADGDGVPNYIDLDSDNDGVSDMLEAEAFESGALDSDQDGIIDQFDVSNTGGLDVDANGIDDSISLIDRDNDGKPDYLDTDSDNDGITDIVEFGGIDADGDGYVDGFVDTDNNGVHDGLVIDVVVVKDFDSDGIPDTHDPDTDGDGVPDALEVLVQTNGDIDGDGLIARLDLDSDNDGIADGVEFGISGLDYDFDDIDNKFDADSTNGIDANGDGIDDSWLDKSKYDTDGDMLVDASDVDSDNDGISDAFEAGTGDADNDFELDAYTDLNGDGLSDELFDRNYPDVGIFVLTDSDADGIADVNDTDSDNDGLPDALEHQFIDFDGDGIPDFRDLDSDNDGIHDRYEARSNGMDADRDGISNVFDADVTAGPDTNLDGVDDRLAFSSLLDTDEDGLPDHLDLDSDGDSINDIVEAGATDVNGDGMVDGMLDANGDGAHDGLGPQGLVVPDTDDDGLPDNVDIDADNDTIPDIAEIGEDTSVLVDFDQDGLPDYLDTDSDNDGIKDSEEAGYQSNQTDPVGPTIHPTPDGFDNDPTQALIAYQLIDSNGDGDVNVRDLDSDNDGISDADERGDGELPADTDADGISDFIDIDSDNDTIPDRLEGSGDTDGDGSPDRLDTDSDNDGIADTFESGFTRIDSDGDGIADQFDIDFIDDESAETRKDQDADGLDDKASSDGMQDTDADSIPDFRDLDSDGDGIGDAIEKGDVLSGLDTDADGKPDYLSTDSDGDGIPDATEFQRDPTISHPFGIDTDGDGIPDYRDMDSDNDGIADKTEGDFTTGMLIDSDNDGIADVYDLDSDNDGIKDTEEGLGDTDNDGQADYLDQDSNNDGVSDGLQGKQDNDGNGIPDRLQLTDQEANIDDTIGGGQVTPLDSDGDGIPNYLQKDSDGDGITDSTEGRRDTDGDGLADYKDNDSDNDGIPDAIERTGDSDGDGVIDRHDLDSDNDGVPDSLEADITSETDDNNFVGPTRPIGWFPLDSDEDGIADYIDTDSDNDGLTDRTETQTENDDELDAVTGGETGTGYDKDRTVTTLIDSDGDGQPDLRDQDSDNDGVDDAAELDEDTDGDGIEDFRDRDKDGNGVNDLEEQTLDTDNDGIPDIKDADNDNDGVPDGLDGFVDTDGDGLSNYIDTDSDGDGIPDTIEAGTTPTQKKDSDGDGVPDRLDLDSDNDGVIDSIESATDSDQDGLPDYIDSDSDNDGVSDLEESGGTDTDGDGRIDSFVDTDKNGADDKIDLTSGGEEDSDGDGVSDRLEPGADATMENTLSIAPLPIDSDNDGIPDVAEGEGDQDNDGLVNRLDLDSDNDGILDEYESGFTLFTLRDSDADGHPDYLDSDSDNDGLSDAAEALSVLDDLDVDGVVDSFIDVNRNGVDDGVDAFPVYPQDIDGDGIVDHLDIDTDGDGIMDLVEANGVDADGDGIVDGMLDSDADTIPDRVDVHQTGGADADADGIDDAFDADFTDLKQDQDNDGVADAFDIDANGNGFARIGVSNGSPSSNWPDSNVDGVPDVKQRQDGAALRDFGIIHTGTDGEGSGCSIALSRNARPDPMLFILMLCAWLCLMVRRTARQRQCAGIVQK